MPENKPSHEAQRDLIRRTVTEDTLVNMIRAHELTNPGHTQMIVTYVVSENAIRTACMQCVGRSTGYDLTTRTDKNEKLGEQK